MILIHNYKNCFSDLNPHGLILNSFSLEFYDSLQFFGSLEHLFVILDFIRTLRPYCNEKKVLMFLLDMAGQTDKQSG